MTLYDVLGVPADANPDEITAAYRHLAKQYHPDRTPGDDIAAAHYARVSEAYEVLNDPARRAEYDRDGSVKAPPDRRQELLRVVVPVMMQVIQQTAEFGGRLRDCDLIAKMTTRLREQLGQIETGRDSLKRGVDSLECVAGRFEGDPTDLLNDAIACQLRAVRDQLQLTQEELDRHQRALDYLKTIKYRRDGSVIGDVLPSDAPAKKTKMIYTSAT